MFPLSFTAGIDLRFIIADLLEQKDMVVRGLAHPITFFGGSGVNELRGRTPGLQRNNPGFGTAEFQEWGAVRVSPRNYYKVLESGQNALLFPGGAREAFSGRKDYPLFWPDKVDFVRTAAKFNATILPLSAVGMVDSVNVLAEAEAIVKIPFIGEWARNASTNVGAARYDTSAEEEFLLAPLVSPAMPKRNYFVFGKPIDTKEINHRDKTECEKVYRQAEAEVRRGLDDILRARERDPFKETPKRLAYERLIGKKAPTFPLSELN